VTCWGGVCVRGGGGGDLCGGDSERRRRLDGDTERLLGGEAEGEPLWRSKLGAGEWRLPLDLPLFFFLTPSKPSPTPWRSSRASTGAVMPCEVNTRLCKKESGTAVAKQPPMHLIGKSRNWATSLLAFLHSRVTCRCRATPCLPWQVNDFWVYVKFLP